MKNCSVGIEMVDERFRQEEFAQRKQLKQRRKIAKAFGKASKKSKELQKQRSEQFPERRFARRIESAGESFGRFIKQSPPDVSTPSRGIFGRFAERKEQRSEFVRVNPALDIRRQADQMQFGTFLRPDYEKIAAEMRARRSNRLI